MFKFQLNLCVSFVPGPEKQWRCKRHSASVLCQHRPQGKFLVGTSDWTYEWIHDHVILKIKSVNAVKLYDDTSITWHLGLCEKCQIKWWTQRGVSDRFSGFFWIKVPSTHELICLCRHTSVRRILRFHWQWFQLLTSNMRRVVGDPFHVAFFFLFFARCCLSLTVYDLWLPHCCKSLPVWLQFRGPVFWFIVGISALIKKNKHMLTLQSFPVPCLFFL